MNPGKDLHSHNLGTLSEKKKDPPGSNAKMKHSDVMKNEKRHCGLQSGGGGGGGKTYVPLRSCLIVLPPETANAKHGKAAFW